MLCPNRPNQADSEFHPRTGYPKCEQEIFSNKKRGCIAAFCLGVICSGAWQGYPNLAHVLAGTVLVGHIADFVGLEEQYLRHTFIGVNLGG